MTKEELEKEARINLKRRFGEYFPQLTISYVMGAEPREKHIAELEDKLEQTEKDLADYQFNYPTIKELQKENAELKEKVNILDNCDRLGDVITEAYKDQLTKAKEIIREFMKYEINEYDGSLEIHFEELKKQAEQFLSEVEK